MTTTENADLFNLAARLHRTSPSADTLALVLSTGRLLTDTVAGAAFFASRNAAPAAPEWESTDTHTGEFSEVRATFDRLLTSDEALNAAACTGYSLARYFAGESLGEPALLLRVKDGKRYTEIVMDYDSTKARRSNPDTAEAFAVAAQYVTEGAPIRTTNRAGRGTRGTRLCEGIGPVGVTFSVR